MKITHHAGDVCSGGHFDQATLRECAAWLENRLQVGPERDGSKLRLTTVVRAMERMGWEYAMSDSFDAERRCRIRRWTFVCAHRSVGDASDALNIDAIELGVYRTACLALYSCSAHDQPQSGGLGWGFRSD